VASVVQVILGCFSNKAEQKVYKTSLRDVNNVVFLVSGVGCSCYSDFLLTWNWLWFFGGHGKLQQVPQQCVQVSKYMYFFGIIPENLIEAWSKLAQKLK